MANNQTASTQQFVDVEDIKNGVVILKNGGLRRVLMVSGVNFELKSEDEQKALIGSYQNFLNTLDFSLQIIIHSRKLNIESYLENLAFLAEEERNDLLKNQINEYREFIKSFVEANEIMAKTFFVVVSYESALLDAKEGILSKIPLFGKKKQDDSSAGQSFEENMNQLNQRVDQVVAGLEQMGLRVVPLADEELIELFYNLYNPQTIEKRDLKIAKSGGKNNG